MGALDLKAAWAAALWLASGWASARAGTVPCWVDHGAVVAAAAFGDIAGDFIIDLSRPVSALHDTRANLDGIDAEAATARLEIAGQRLEAVSLPVVDLDPQTRPFDTTINGIIGWDVLGRYAVTLDLRRGGCRLALTRSGRVRGGSPLAIVGGAPVIDARITDGRTVRADVFRIDTGRAVSHIAGASLARPPPAADAPARLRAVSIQGAIFEQVPAESASNEDTGSALGTGVWRGALIVTDPRHGRMRIDFDRP